MGFPQLFPHPAESGRWHQTYHRLSNPLIGLSAYQAKYLKGGLAQRLLRCKTEIMGLLDTLKSLFAQHRIASNRDLQEFLETRAAYLVQKSITEYSQARANMMFISLLGERQFQSAYETARWTAYPAGLAMVAEVVAGQLRGRLGLNAAAAETLVAGLSNTVIEKMSNHGPLSDEQWSAASKDIETALARADLAAPRHTHAIAGDRARIIFDALPFHEAIRKHDFTMFGNTLAFHLAEIATELEEAELAPGIGKE